MRITRYSRSSGRGDRVRSNPYRRRGSGGGGPHDEPHSREYASLSQHTPHSTYSQHGHGRQHVVRRNDWIATPERKTSHRDAMVELAHERHPRERERRREDDASRRSSRDLSLSSVLSEISSGSSCFGTVRASEAYGSPVYEDLTEDDLRSLDLEFAEDEEEVDLEDEEDDDQTMSSAGMIVAPPVIKHKKRKKDKKKKEKAKERERKRAKRERRRQKEILEERICPPDHEVAQSKEIFASGQNILVSVSFIDNEKTKERDKHRKSKRKKLKKQKIREKVTITKQERLTGHSSGKIRRHSASSSNGDPNMALESISESQQHQSKPMIGLMEQQKQQNSQEQEQQKESAIQPPSKKKKLDPGVKPVMVIDLERSPGGQVISSPREVIVLSDEEGKRGTRGKEEAKANENDLSNRGPNTPPEPAPKSPDSYDPFEPTKSSPSSGISRHEIGTLSTISYPDHHHHHQHHQEAVTEEPKEVKTEFHQPHHHAHHGHVHHHHLHHHHHHSHHHQSHHTHGNHAAPPERSVAAAEHATSVSAGFNDDSILDLHPESPFEKLDVNSPRTAISSLPPQSFHPSPMKAIIRSMPKKLLAAGGGNSRDSRSHSTAPKANANSGTTLHGATMSGRPGIGPTTSGGVPFEEELNDGDISPYSPRSSDCDAQLFEPPQDGNGGETQTIALTVDNLRKVFGNDPKTLYGDLRKSYQHCSVIAVDEMYKPHKMTMEMLDEIPDSAVDMQVKEKLMKKLQRQERIVEEVKHFLKPHFNKKRIDKDEYKEIMRKSIPKICHSRSGEINPVKIQALITAYVKKAIASRRLLGGGEMGSASATPMASVGYVPSTTGAPAP
ncbi:protein split ends-like [Anopheles darlingi]|uniref:protein split ends-like n=1 Tax=Anopheles darlingi TaxID=43151 RepID=UPI0021004FE3|nr:protein split ends-like [Anopheles darlingi]